MNSTPRPKPEMYSARLPHPTRRAGRQHSLGGERWRHIRILPHFRIVGKSARPYGETPAETLCRTRRGWFRYIGGL